MGLRFSLKLRCSLSVCQVWISQRMWVGRAGDEDCTQAHPGMEKEPEGQSPRPSNGRSSSLSMPEGTASLCAAYKLFTGLPSSPSHLGRSDSVPDVLVTVLCPNPGRASIIGSESPATKGLWLLLNAANCSLPKASDQADSPRWATGCSSYFFLLPTGARFCPIPEGKKNPPFSLARWGSRRLVFISYIFA